MVNFEQPEDAYQELVDELAELRRIAGFNIIRAADIMDRHKDEEVSQLLIAEASVMLSVATKVEYLLGVEPPENRDANL